MEPVYWTTKSGVVMNVDDMDDTHVRNTLKMLLRKIQSPRKRNTEFKINGDMAQSSIDDAISYEMWEELNDHEQ
jgi:predicted transcriptional regulator